MSHDDRVDCHQKVFLLTCISYEKKSKENKEDKESEEAIVFVSLEPLRHTVVGGVLFIFKLWYDCGMKLMLHGLNMELTSSIRTHLEEKCKALEHFLDPKHAALAELRVEVGKPSQHHRAGDVFQAEANLKIGGEFFRATATHEDLHAAINDMKDELERQFRKHKTKEISKHRRETPA